VNRNVGQFIADIVKNNEDIENCVELLTNSFSFLEDHEKLRETMTFFLHNAPELHCLIIKNESKIIALQCVLNREILFFGVPFKVAGMSYAGIAKEFQNSEVGTTLKTNLFNYINTNADLSLGFARKAMDNYWYPYGYRGVTNFCEITLSLTKVPIGKKEFSSRKATPNDIDLLDRFYKVMYDNSVGPLSRNIELWNFYLKKLSKQSQEIIIIIENDIEIGYCLLQDNYVLELGFNKDFHYCVFQFLCQKIKNGGYSNIIFKLGATHPLVKVIEKYEYSISKRYVWRGGHIAKITNISQFLTKFNSILELRLVNALVGNFNVSCNEILFTFHNKTLVISDFKGEKADINFEKSEWVKLIFGVVPVQSLVGFSSTGYLNIMNILFPECNPQFPELDQF
jgi:predicted acetyltransferase